jgi:cytochrome P450
MNRSWVLVSRYPLYLLVLTLEPLLIHLQFGIGSRTCIGRHVSMLEMCKLIPRIVRDFGFELDGAVRGKDWHTQNFWFVKPVDFKIRVRVRQLDEKAS